MELTSAQVYAAIPSSHSEPGHGHPLCPRYDLKSVQNSRQKSSIAYLNGPETALFEVETICFFDIDGFLAAGWLASSLGAGMKVRFAAAGTWVGLVSAAMGATVLCHGPS